MLVQIHLQKIVPKTLSGIRLDQAASKLFPQHSRNRLCQWIKKQQITVNGEYKRPRDHVHAGDFIVIKAELEERTQAEAQALPLDIIHEDKHLLVINKPHGLVVHPGAGNPDQTLLNALLHHDPHLTHLPRAGIIHRLDKDTSGLMMIAKTLSAHTFLIEQLQQRLIERYYVAIINGTPITGGKIDAPIARHPHHRTRMAVQMRGKPAVTHFRILEKFSAHSYIKLKLESGRTHQIRVHMAHIKHPIVGDPVYGGNKKFPPKVSNELRHALENFAHQALHAQALRIQHPHTNKNHYWEVKPPHDMLMLLNLLRNKPQ